MTGDDDPNRCYKMTSNPRGFALVINNRKFLDSTHERTGSEHDYSTMQQLLWQLNYQVSEYENVKSTVSNQNKDST